MARADLRDHIASLPNKIVELMSLHDAAVWCHLQALRDTLSQKEAHLFSIVLWVSRSNHALLHSSDGHANTSANWKNPIMALWKDYQCKASMARSIHGLYYSGTSDTAIYNTLPQF